MPVKLEHGSAPVSYTHLDVYKRQTAVKQTIQAKNSYKKTVGDKAFSLNAKAKTPLTYTSSDKKIATIDKNGKVTVKKAGKVTITVKAAATSQYQAAGKTITITVTKKAVKKAAK